MLVLSCSNSSSKANCWQLAGKAWLAEASDPGGLYILYHQSPTPTVKHTQISDVHTSAPSQGDNIYWPLLAYGYVMVKAPSKS